MGEYFRPFGDVKNYDRQTRSAGWDKEPSPLRRKPDHFRPALGREGPRLLLDNPSCHAKRLEEWSEWMRQRTKSSEP